MMLMMSFKVDCLHLRGISPTIHLDYYETLVLLPSQHQDTGNTLRPIQFCSLTHTQVHSHMHKHTYSLQPSSFHCKLFATCRMKRCHSFPSHYHFTINDSVCDYGLRYVHKILLFNLIYVCTYVQAMVYIAWKG